MSSRQVRSDLLFVTSHVSVVQQIKDCIELSSIHERLNLLLTSPTDDLNELQSLLRELTQLLTVARLDYQRLVFHPPTTATVTGGFLDVPLSICSESPVVDSWAAIICHQAHILLLISRLICFTSKQLGELLPSGDIHQYIDQRCEEAGFPIASLSSSQHQSRTGGAASDLSQVLAFIELSESIILQLILQNWTKLLPETFSGCGRPSRIQSPDVPDAFSGDLVKDYHRLPKFSWVLAAAMNSLYNRVISLIGKSVDRRQFEKLEGNQNRLDLIAFVITEDDRVSAFLEEIVSLIGLRVTPSPLLSLTLNIEGLLDRFASVLLVELRKYLNQALLSCRAVSDSSMGPDLLLPWEVRTIEKTIIVGPLPELIFEIFQTFLEMARTPDSYLDNSIMSRLRLLNMNKVIIHSVLASYDLLREEFGRIFEGLTNMFDHSLLLGSDDSQQSQRVLEERHSQFILQNMSLLCSIANDCDRVSTTHLPKLWKHAVVALTVDDQEGCGDLWSKSQTYLQHLNGHVSDLQIDIKKIAWTAIEILTRVIFTDMRYLYLIRFEEILESPADHFPIFSSILRTLEDYLADLKINLLPEYFRMLVLSSCHKIIHRSVILTALPDFIDV